MRYIFDWQGNVQIDTFNSLAFGSEAFETSKSE